MVVVDRCRHRLVELVGPIEDSAAYQIQGVNIPYFTRQGEWAGPGGVGGRSPNSPDLGQHKNVGGYAVNGGHPHQNMPTIKEIRL